MTRRWQPGTYRRFLASALSSCRRRRNSPRPPSLNSRRRQRGPAYASTDDMDGVRSIDRIDTQSGDTFRSDTLSDGSKYYAESEEHPESDPCIISEVRAELVARRINRALESHDWRPLQQLDVVIADPYDADRTPRPVSG